MPVQAALHIDLFFVPSEILVDVFVELVANVDVLPLLISGFLSAEAATGMKRAVHNLTGQDSGVGDKALHLFSDRLRNLWSTETSNHFGDSFRVAHVDFGDLTVDSVLLVGAGRQLVVGGAFPPATSVVVLTRVGSASDQLLGRTVMHHGISLDSCRSVGDGTLETSKRGLRGDMGTRLVERTGIAVPHGRVASISSLQVLRLTLLLRQSRAAA